MNLPLYWKKVNDLAVTLPESVYITSLENDVVGTKPGSTVTCDRKLAAERIVSNTHRIAKPEEVAKLLAHQEEKQLRDDKRNVRYAPKSVLLVSPEQHRAMAAVPELMPAAVVAPGKAGKAAEAPAAK